MKKSYSDMTLTELRDNGYTVIVWTSDDVNTLRPDCTGDECDIALGKISKQLCDCSIEAGWDIMDTLLDDELLD